MQTSLWFEIFGQDNIDIDNLNRYFSFLLNCSNLSVESPSHTHHILPKSLDINNQCCTETITLSIKNHYYAHYLIPDIFITPYIRGAMSAVLSGLLQGEYVDQIPKDLLEAGRKKMSLYMQNFGNPTYGKVFITDGISMKLINKNSDVPEGWRLGMSDMQKEKNSIGHLGHVVSRNHREKLSKSLRGQIWITDGIQNKKIPQSASLPSGWRYGQCDITKAKKSVGHLHKLYITDGIHERRICDTDLIPSGWYIGLSEPHKERVRNAKHGISTTAGKIWIQNGQKQTLISKDTPIPDGWQKGMLPRNK